MSIDYGESWKLRLTQWCFKCNVQRGVLRARTPKPRCNIHFGPRSYEFPLDKICGVHQYRGWRGAHWIELVTSSRAISFDVRSDNYLPGFSEVTEFIERVNNVAEINRSRGLETGLRKAESRLATILRGSLLMLVLLVVALVGCWVLLALLY